MATATAPQPARLVPATYWADPSIYRFSVEQYQRMGEAGILADDERVELLEGYVVREFPRTPRHDGTVSIVDHAVRPFVRPGWGLRSHLNVVLADSQPLPDFAVTRGGSRAYMARHPGAGDVALVIEVADASLARDQADKGRIYARADIPVYWIINLVDRQVEVYTGPSGAAYATLDTYAPGDDVPLVLDGVTVATVPAAELLP